MAKEENSKKKSPHEQLLERASTKYPDRRFRGQIGQDGQEGQDDLEQAIMDMLSESDTQMAEDASKNAALVEMFRTSPECGEFLTEWVRSGNPAGALVKVFGDRLDNLSTEEGRAAFSEEYTSWRNKVDENNKKNSEAEANWQKSLEDLDQWGNDKGLNDEQKSQNIIRLMDIVNDGIMNIYKPEDFDMVLKETNFNTAVETARREGEVAGRNEKIAQNRRNRNAVSSMPPTLSGQGLRGEEKKPSKPESVWAGIK